MPGALRLFAGSVAEGVVFAASERSSIADSVVDLGRKQPAAGDHAAASASALSVRGNLPKIAGHGKGDESGSMGSKGAGGGACGDAGSGRRIR